MIKSRSSVSVARVRSASWAFSASSAVEAASPPEFRGFSHWAFVEAVDPYDNVVKLNRAMMTRETVFG